MIPLIVLAAVFVLIAVRQVGKLRLCIWQIMLFGSIAVLLTGQISPIEALKSINIDVMLFLFGMFVIGSAIQESGYLGHMSYKLFKKAKNPNALLLFILFGAGFASALLVNDTLAIIGTPVMLLLAKKHNIKAKVLLLTLAFAITIGSVMSPIGNPQNLLIAVNGNIKNPFVTFIKFLFIPTVINLFAAFLMLKLFYPGSFNNCNINHSDEPVSDKHLAALSKASVLIIIALIALKIIFMAIGLIFDFKLTYIALIACAPILLFSKRRLVILSSVDWHTLIFFASMFVLMASVWQSGFIQGFLAYQNIGITSIPAIFLISVLVSQLVSNVPLVALYMPMLMHAGAKAPELMALAAGSTIAGNLTIIGAASNVMIIQGAERKSNETISFLEFARIGIPLTVINIIVYAGYTYIAFGIL